MRALPRSIWLLTLLMPVVWLAGCAQSPTSSSDSAYAGNRGSQVQGDVESARVHTELGAEYFRLQRYEVALEEFNTAIEKSPSYALAHNGLGLVYSVLGDAGKAETAFVRAIQLEPGNSESHNNYGRFLCDQRRFDASIKEFMLAVKNPLYKTPQVAYYNAGVCAL
ncbi:MAG TPA: tetratricopeptide repeat protein, partial [Methylophilus sp.]